MLEARFRQCSGHQKITRKEYALRSKTQDNDIERTSDFRRCFLPGRRVEMSIIFEPIVVEVGVCPRCKSRGNEEYRESYIEWYNSLAPSVVHVLTYCSSGCSLRYPRTFKQLKTKSSAAIEFSSQHQGLRILKGEGEDTPKQFRRIRLKTWHIEVARCLPQELCVDFNDSVFEEFQVLHKGVRTIYTIRCRSSVKVDYWPTPDMILW